jgi:hypothetical protein
MDGEALVEARRRWDGRRPGGGRMEEDGKDRGWLDELGEGDWLFETEKLVLV